MLTVLVWFLACATIFAATKIDSRLASVRKAYLVAADELGDDQFVVACLPEKLKALTPIVAVERKEDADVLLTIEAHIPSKGARYALGGMGKTPSARIEAKLPDGTLLWSDGAKTGKLTSGGLIGASRSETGIACALAEGLANTLRDAMRDARDKK